MNYLVIFILSLFSFSKEKNTIVVAKDGSGDFTTIQAAIESVKDSAAAYSTLIYIKQGEYREKVFIAKSGLILRGETTPKLGGKWTDTEGSKSFIRCHAKCSVVNIPQTIGVRRH